MIGVDEIEDILQIAQWSGALPPPEKPLSVILIGPVGTGKTSMLKKTHRRGTIKKVKVIKKSEEKEVEMRQIRGSVLYTTDTTPYVLRTRYGQLLKSGQIHHIAIPDFLAVVGQPKHILETHVKFYNSLVEEGILAIETRDGSFVSEIPISVGLLTAIARGDFDNRKDTWGAVGFLSRMLPVSYKYSAKTSMDARDSVKIKAYTIEPESFDIELPENAKPVDIPLELADEIEKVALATKDSRDELGIRRQKQLQVFCMSNALRDGRDSVEREDVDKLKKYSRYFNYDCSAEL